MNLKPDFSFVLKLWLLSRGLIVIAMFAALLTSPVTGEQAKWGWGVFSAWDSTFYQQIAATGYEGTLTAPGANVAFFPVFPLLIWMGMKLGLSVEMASVVVSNLAFLVASLLLYDWMATHKGSQVARWVTAVFLFCPLSLFGTVAYTEGVFLLVTVAALSAFDRQNYVQASIWGFLATATRITGLALIVAFAISLRECEGNAAWHQRLPKRAYFVSLVSSGGIGLFSGYCWLRFGDPLAFITVQYSQWQKDRGIDWGGWGRMFIEITAGGANWRSGGLKDLWHPFLFLLICALALAWWYYRKRLGKATFDYGCWALLFLLWLLAGDPLLNTVSVLGGIYLIWFMRRKLSFVTVIYGFTALGLLLVSGGTASLNRYVYGIISVSVALGVLLSQHRRWGYATLGFFSLLLVMFSIRFAQHQWVA